MISFSARIACQPMATIVLLLGVFVACLLVKGTQSIGVCYGMDGNNLPSRPEVIQMYKDRNIAQMRLYHPDRQALDALRGSNIQVLLGLPNDQLQRVASDASAASTWVRENVQNYYPAVQIKIIAVGNEVIPAQGQLVLQAMRNVYNSLRSANLQDQIKVSTAVDTGVLGMSSPPSNGAFNDAARGALQPIVQFLSTTGAPLLANVYPYISYIDNTAQIKLEFALFTLRSVEVQDGQFQYRNLFDAILDAMYAALEKMGAPGLEIVVSESGWPSGGHPAATVANARTYNQNLIDHVKRGTPRRSGRAVQTYIFAMFNENLKDVNGHLGQAERNFGLFFPNKQPVYPINFS